VTLALRFALSGLLRAPGRSLLRVAVLSGAGARLGGLLRFLGH